jgi:formylglycine-generating enzyme required for sulfatase activity
MGLHDDYDLDEAPTGTYEQQKRAFLLSNGETVFDVAGCVYSWVFDDVQGDADGLVAKAFTADSPSIATAPYPSMEKGMGWRPRAGADWSGRALVRGGCWSSGSYAGVFCLNLGWPDYERDGVGFRCTKGL